MNEPKWLVAKDENKPDQRLVYAEVYAPNRPDSDGEFMTAAEIQKMAHAFTAKGEMGNIDVMHDNEVVPGCKIVESFIARKGDPDFIEGSWVVGMHVDNDDLWRAIKSEQINGFSMEAMVYRHEREVEIEIPPVVSGTTQKSEGGDGHIHKFYVTYDDHGRLAGGRTDMVNGHFHEIRAGTVTELSQQHRHKFSAVDTIEVHHG